MVKLVYSLLVPTNLIKISNVKKKHINEIVKVICININININIIIIQIFYMLSFILLGITKINLFS